MKIILFIISTVATSVSIINFFKESDSTPVTNTNVYSPRIPAPISSEDPGNYIFTLILSSTICSLFIYGILFHYAHHIIKFLLVIFFISLLAKVKHFNFKTNKIYTISCIAIVIFTIVIILTYQTEEAKYVLNNYKSGNAIWTLFSPLTDTFKQFLHKDYSFSSVTLQTLVPFYYIFKPYFDVVILYRFIIYINKYHEANSKLNYKQFINDSLFPYSATIFTLSAVKTIQLLFSVISTIILG